jgi:TctA family transporter
MVENAFRQSLIISGGRMLIFFKRPVSAGLFFLGFLLLFSPLILRLLGRIRPALLMKGPDEDL